MEINNSTTKEDIVVFLEQLAKYVKKSIECDYAKFSVINEARDVPTKYNFELESSGWTNVNFDIRFLQKVKGKTIKARSKKVEKYWLRFYCNNYCTLCGNTGIVDTTGAKTPTGLVVGKINYCICPNGQEMRKCKTPIKIKGE